MIQIAPLGSISSRDWILVCVAIILKQIDVVWLFFLIENYSLMERWLLSYGLLCFLYSQGFGEMLGSFSLLRSRPPGFNTVSSS